MRVRIEADHFLGGLVLVHVSVERVELFVERFGAVRIAARLRLQGGEFAIFGELDLFGKTAMNPVN